MELRELKELLNNVADGAVSPDDAASRLRTQPYTELGYAKVDNQRGIRQGVSEIIYGEGKTAQQIEGICNAMLAAGQQRILITRLSADKCAQLSNLPSSTMSFRVSALLAACRNLMAMAPWWWLRLAPATCQWPRRRPSPRRWRGAA